VIFPNDHLRANRELIAENTLSASALWRFGISGDLPIVLVTCSSVDELEFAAQILRAQVYWRVKGLDADVVIVNEQAHSYTQTLQSALEAVAQSSAALWTTEAAAGAVHVLRADLMAPEERRLLYAAARVVLRPARGSLSEQLYVPETQSAPRPRRERKRAADRRSRSRADARIQQQLRRLLPRTDASTSSRWNRTWIPLRRGSTSSPIPGSAAWSRRAEQRSRGPRTAARTSSPRGRTIR
jgi:cellobiose phosphorylase